MSMKEYHSVCFSNRVPFGAEQARMTHLFSQKRNHNYKLLYRSLFVKGLKHRTKNSMFKIVFFLTILNNL